MSQPTSINEAQVNADDMLYKAISIYRDINRELKMQIGKYQAEINELKKEQVKNNKVEPPKK